MTELSRHCARRTRYALGFVFLSTTIGCLSIPVRVTPQTQGPGGPGTVADTSQIQPGKTMHDEVLHDWKWCDSHLDSDRLFVGSLTRSPEKRVETLRPIYAGNERLWELQNLFVEFDAKGVVTKSYYVPTRHFLREITSWVKRAPPPPLDISRPIEIKAEIGTGSFLHKGWAEHGRVVLAADGLEMRSEDQNGPSPVHIRLEQVEALHSDDWSGQHLRIRGVPGGSNVNLVLKPAEICTLVRYLKQVRESALPPA